MNLCMHKPLLTLPWRMASQDALFARIPAGKAPARSKERLAITNLRRVTRDVGAFRREAEEMAGREEASDLPPAIGDQFDEPEHAAHDFINAVRLVALRK